MPDGLPVQQAREEFLRRPRISKWAMMILASMISMKRILSAEPSCTVPWGSCVNRKAIDVDILQMSWCSKF
jgi:hypothetical protein